MGEVGILNDNVLGLREGVYLKSLPPHIHRIVPWLGRHNLEECGWEMVLARGQGYVVNTYSGKELPITYDDRIRLPVLGVNFHSHT